MKQDVEIDSVGTVIGYDPDARQVVEKPCLFLAGSGINIVTVPRRKSRRGKKCAVR